jgi:DinB superfamily
MKSTAGDLELLINEYAPALKALSKTGLEKKPSPAKWSGKEIIGHLVDSAQSNIRRFVMAQYEETPYIVYNQTKWVEIVNYQHWDSNQLIDLWYLLNKQVCEILKNMSPAAAQLTCRTQETHTIEWLANDYIKHLRHHIHVVLDREPVAYP